MYCIESLPLTRKSRILTLTHANGQGEGAARVPRTSPRRTLIHQPSLKGACTRSRDPLPPLPPQQHVYYLPCGVCPGRQ